MTTKHEKHKQYLQIEEKNSYQRKKLKIMQDLTKEWSKDLVREHQIVMKQKDTLNLIIDDVESNLKVHPLSLCKNLQSFPKSVVCLILETMNCFLKEFAIACVIAMFIFSYLPIRGTPL